MTKRSDVWLMLPVLLLAAALRWAALPEMTDMLGFDESAYAADAAAWLAAAFVGVLTVAATYRLGGVMFGHRAGLGAAASMAVLYWPVHLSHIAMRANPLPALGALSIAFLLGAVRSRRLGLWIAAGLFGGLLIYSYTSAYVWAALVGLLLLVFALRGQRGARRVLLDGRHRPADGDLCLATPKSSPPAGGAVGGAERPSRARRPGCLAAGLAGSRRHPLESQHPRSAYPRSSGWCAVWDWAVQPGSPSTLASRFDRRAGRHLDPAIVAERIPAALPAQHRPDRADRAGDGAWRGCLAGNGQRVDPTRASPSSRRARGWLGCGGTHSNCCGAHRA